ncbi:ferritin-like domain-containing protein [Aequorivita lipolytica]|uniref:PA2169 family four-helix-bundle protein n=1 Tax=Aequorivita lipolytica TaxID=153267 RepID=A0A5C6YMI4_9FLAO|nr:PA2169 family four-helix-bundle protein [Aequorivita lipolytica]TXD68293.1 PA2169 family four-helix-bundle protein [Aequorivita lipolytica]SRX53437.1 hypothetical protein AEQU2_02668 [Aequorivita lipolytica]
MKQTEEISEKINALIEKNNDAYKGFKKASENAESKHLRDYLIQQASERQAFAKKLTGSLMMYNPDFDVDTTGSVTGSLHRTWIDGKAALSMDDDESILEECIRGDKASVEEYQEFLEDYPSTSTEVSNTIREQLHNIKSTLERVSRLEDLH